MAAVKRAAGVGVAFLLALGAAGKIYDIASHERQLDKFLLSEGAPDNFLDMSEREWRERNGNFGQKVLDALRQIGVIPGLTTSDLAPVRVQNDNQFPFVDAARVVVGEIVEPPDNGPVYAAAAAMNAQSRDGRLEAGGVAIMDGRDVAEAIEPVGIACTSSPVACSFQNP